MRRGHKGRRKGKGKGTGRGGQRLFRKKGSSDVAEEQQDASHSWDWQDAGGTRFGPGKKNLLQKNPTQPTEKGRKARTEKRKVKWSSKDGKGNGGKDNYAHDAAEAPQPSPSFSAMAASAFSTVHKALNLFEDEGIFKLLKIHVFKASCQLLTHALTPASIALDLGWARAMMSWRTAQSLMKSCDGYPVCGLW